MSDQDTINVDIRKKFESIFEEISKYIKPDPIVIIGDSIVQWFRINEFIPNTYIINRGIDGDTTSGILSRLQNSVNDLNPKKLFILIGTNDLPINSNEKILTNYKEILINVISNNPACDIYIISILPTSGWVDRSNKRIMELNIEFEKIAEQFDVQFLNLHSLFCDTDFELKKEFSEDGLHINQAGYNIFAKKIRTCL